MNVAKNMEVIAVAAAILISASCYAIAPALQVASSTATLAVPAGKTAMHVVVVKAKRLNAAEKARFA
ncbi:hypothetical protein [Janthinobacterium sp. BJB446]|uniref:hypothetical protein n=1 Tax=Janthinobacterium sp. BJB446 TaxID=2048009 RepID=UPI000C1238F7|nr:hypothetical protein [Janthinobacterium sp. BJB446]